MAEKENNDKVTWSVLKSVDLKSFTRLQVIENSKGYRYLSITKYRPGKSVTISLGNMDEFIEQAKAITNGV